MSQVEISSHSELPLAESSGVFQPEPSPEPSKVEELQTLVAGLTWMSESDYPFEVSQLPDRDTAPSVEELLQLTGHDEATPVQEMSLRDFFAPAVQPQDWHEEGDRQRLQRFQTLLQWLEQHLGDGRVYRFGTIEIDVLIIGKTETGTCVTLSTKAIET
jgi:Nuclease A inhibitor-like protein